jgi:hypothetical protein
MLIKTKSYLFAVFFLGLISVTSNNVIAMPNKTLPMATVPISKFNFVFIETQGTIQDTFENELKSITQYVLKFGALNPIPVVMFLDFYSPKNINNQSTFKKEIPGEKKNSQDDFINRKLLVDHYGLAYLNDVRKVLVGVLVFPDSSISFSGDVKVYEIANVKAKAFQSIMFTENQPNEYYIDNRIYDRTSMLRYMRNNTAKYIGMIEMLDTQNNIITFMALPGNQKEFLYKLKISGIKPQEKNNGQS